MSDTGDVIEPDPAAAAARRIGPLSVIFSFFCFLFFFFSYHHRISLKRDPSPPSPSQTGRCSCSFSPSEVTWSVTTPHWLSTTTAHFHHRRRFYDCSENCVVPRIVCARVWKDRLKRGGQTSSAGWLLKAHVISHPSRRQRPTSAVFLCGCKTTHQRGKCFCCFLFFMFFFFFFCARKVHFPLPLGVLTLGTGMSGMTPGMI